MKNIDANGQYSRIENTTIIKGEILSEGDFRVDGTLEGTIKTSGRVIVGKEGKILGGVTCQNADVEGKIKGNLFVEENLTLKPTCILEGDVATKRLIVESGATFNATCTMGEAEKEVKSLPKQDAHEKTA
ncbi:MAG: polymer-forming cytoskeletal protein [Bacteroidetes bacterium]|nr:polymer-forming cytoskeletal protein [Bacteroidota bacterium]MDA0938146.1 polymer-forming cytoskeletal protein [Bacteroidota bacterium]MDA1344514.1 polymer-forming cytoskeletal protein [Bacteroidota bacterium]